MRELSLFSGAGGGLLGTKLLGFQHVGYVEFDDYCQRVIKQRISDGILDEAPIFADVREFAQSGAAKQYRGFADVLTAGFPCQPFSVAGSQKADDDERNMWPATLRVIREVQPRFCLLENVPGLLGAGEKSFSLDDGTAGYFRYIYTIFRDLAEAGYDARWCVLGADDCGAPHRRKRLWIFAYANSNKLWQQQIHEHRQQIKAKLADYGASEFISDTEHDGPFATTFGRGNAASIFNHQKRPVTASEFKRIRASGNVADTASIRLQRRKYEWRKKPVSKWTSNKSKIVDATNTNSIRPSRPWWSIDPSCSAPEEDWQINRAIDGSRWGIKSRLGRVANGVANRVDRLKGTGNGQVSVVAALAWIFLTGLD